MKKQDFTRALETLIKECVQLMEQWQQKNLKQQEKGIAVFMEYASAKHFQYHLAAVAVFSKSRKNRDLALENLRDEIGGNHPSLGRVFCKQIGVIIDSSKIETIWSLDQILENKENSVFMTGFLAACEACSPIIMRALIEHAKQKGVESVYLEIHAGELEEHHAEILLEGLQAEVKAAKTNFTDAVQGVERWRDLLYFCFS